MISRRRVEPVIRDLKQQRRQQQLQKTIGLTTKTTAVQVHHAF